MPWNGTAICKSPFGDPDREKELTDKPDRGNGVVFSGTSERNIGWLLRPKLRDTLRLVTLCLDGIRRNSMGANASALAWYKSMEEAGELFRSLT